MLADEEITPRSVLEYVAAQRKGDVVGHEFHGNQWTGGQGGADTATLDLPKGWNKIDNAGDDASMPVMSGAERWIEPNLKMTIEFAANVELRHDQKVGLAETLTRLGTTNPMGSPFTVQVLPNALSTTSYGVTYGKYLVQLNADTWKLDPTKPDEHVFPGGEGSLETWGRFVGRSVPEARLTSPADYVMTHEYGHLLEERNPFNLTHSLAIGDAIHAADPPSSYGNWYHSNDHEAYAEAFAEWHLSGGETKMPIARTLAEMEGWK